jgi:hypothetical protein
LKSEENLNDFKYLYDAQSLDNDAVYDKDNVELINVDNILSPYFNESIKINKNTFNNLNEYVIYSLATYIKDESIINRLGQLVVKKQYNAEDRLFVWDLLKFNDEQGIPRNKFKLDIITDTLNRNDIVNIITYFLRHKEDSAKLGIVDNAYIENIRKKRVYLLKDLLSKHIKGNDELQSELLKLSSKNIVIQTREQSC